jgi:hypothetical protein
VSTPSTSIAMAAIALIRSETDTSQLFHDRALSL